MKVLYQHRVRALLFFSLLFFSGFAQSQHVYSGRVLDLNDKQPVSGADVIVQGWLQKATTDANGYFSITTGIGDIEMPDDFSISLSGEGLICRTASPAQIQLVNLLGQSAGVNRQLSGEEHISLAAVPDGFYLLIAENQDRRREYKLWKNDRTVSLSGAGKENQEKLKGARLTADSIVISKSGFYTQKYGLDDNRESFPILRKSYENGVDYLDELICPEAFEMLEYAPDRYTFSEVKSLKLVYSISDQKIYYLNSSKYELHYDFCSKILDYSKGQTAFGQEQYSDNPNRIYMLATLNYFTASGIYTFEFIPADKVNCEDIATVYSKIAATTFFGDRLRFYANSPEKAQCTDVPIISSDELYKGQNYQPLNVQENYGYLQKVDASQLPYAYLGRHDIVLLNTIPTDIAVVAGIVTTEFQTPLSHINVLSHNRGTPNMALRDGWTNPKLNNFLGKLIYLKVALDSFTVREATIDEAQRFWSQIKPQTVHKLKLDTLTNGLVDLNAADVSWVSTVGGKAANFAELTKVAVSENQKLPLPENYFAIPFFYYVQHMKQNRLDVIVKNMLKDPQFVADVNYRKQKLDALRSAIKKAPLDPAFLQMVKDRLANADGFTSFRFRSSTNAEDVEGFNGAGLYESFTGSLTDPDKPIDKAIKKVWASLWDFAAFEERDYFKIDHSTIAMGVLVHRNYPAEAANGVAITENIYNSYMPAVTINVQVGEISVVSPDENYLPDQVLYYTRSNANTFEYISHTTVPGMEGKTVMTDAELRELKDYCMAIHNHYCRINLECNPMDIEFKVDVVNGQRKVYIKQARLY